MEAEEKARSLEQEVSDLKDKAAKAQEELERRLEDAETQIESYHRAQMALLASRSVLGNKLLNPSAPSFVPARAGAVATSLPPAPTASARSATRDTRGTAKPTSRDFPWVTHGISDLDADSAGPLKSLRLEQGPASPPPFDLAIRGFIMHELQLSRASTLLPKLHNSGFKHHRSLQHSHNLDQPR